jgi:type IV secretion system protein VirD4
MGKEFSTKTASFAGYKLRVFNLKEMENSNNYNPFNYVYDEHGKLSEPRVKTMKNVLYERTKGEGEKDDFWSKKGQALLEAITYLLFEESQYNAQLDENGEIIPETRDFSHLNFFSVTEKMRKLVFKPKGSKKEDGYTLTRLTDESDDEFLARREKGHLCGLDLDYMELERRKPNCLALRLYMEVRNAPEETGQSFLSSANVKTFMFNMDKVINLTCCDDIELDKIGDKKTALFIITSPVNPTLNFLAAMMYTQLFDVLDIRATHIHGGRLPVEVRCIMDEFANIGEIPNFDKTIAYIRSLGVSMNVIVQNIAQIKAKYEKTWEIITGNCDSFLFLGGSEESTLKYVSEMLGKETIDIRSYNVTKGRQGSTSEQNSIVGRELMLPNEISNIPTTDCILKIRAANPFYCNKFFLKDHPNIKYLGDEDENPDWLFDLTSLKVKILADFEAQTA